MTHLITSRTDWTPGLIDEVYKHIEDVAVNDLKLDVYPNILEIITAEQMIDNYASVALPVNYSHWSFGKAFMRDMSAYQKGRSGLAYEIVLNSNPTIAYLMEENDMITQALVIAHASFGHNFVYKNNVWFREWTSASSIIDYMVFAKSYIKNCEERYGEAEVERVLDAAHTLALHGVDKFRRKSKKRMTEEEEALDRLKKEEDEVKHKDSVIDRTSIKPEVKPIAGDLDDMEDEDNILYFIYKNSPNMEQWKREICRIIYKIQNYFYPQRFSSVVHEGMATHTHFYIMNKLEERGLISPDAQMAWLRLHSGVIYQPDMHSRHYHGQFNPYALGFDILKEIRRVCEEPTKEDEEWFPLLVGKDWRTEMKHAVSEYRNETLIEQYLTPALMRKYKMMTVDVDGKNGSPKDGWVGQVTQISDEAGYRDLRRMLARQYSLIEMIPEISVHKATMKGTRKLTLIYKPYRGRSLYEPYALKTIDHIRYLWGYDVEVIMGDNVKNTKLFEPPSLKQPGPMSA